jgi:hypothetical protein
MKSCAHREPNEAPPCHLLKNVHVGSVVEALLFIGVAMEVLQETKEYTN